MFKNSINKPTIFLHIGMNKTGSTALQTWLSTNRVQLLQSDGIYYPEEGLQGVAHYRLSDVLGFRHSQKPINRNDVNKLHKIFSQSIKNNNCQKVVFSSEFFVINKDIGIIKNFFQGLECKVVIYLRRHDYWWESSYNQSLRTVRQPSFPKGIDAYLKHQKRVSTISDYKALVERWAKVFGKCNIIIRPYEQQSLPNGIVANFLKVIACEHYHSATDDIKVNVSLSKYANAVLEVAQRSGLSDNEISKVLLFLKENDKPDNNFSLLSPKRRRVMINNYLPQYQYIANNYLTNNNGTLFAEKWPQINDEWQEFIAPEPEEILATILKAISK